MPRCSPAAGVSGAGTLRWDLEWRSTAFAVVLVPLLVALGFWQLQRADEKRELLAGFQARQQAPAVSLAAALAGAAGDDLRGRPVRLRGHFLTGRYLLLDNRLRGGRYGHEVLALFRDQPSGLIVAVNRGWIAADPARRSLPEVPAPPAGQGPVELDAVLHTPTGEPFRLAPGPERIRDWPAVLQNLDLAAVARGLGVPLDGLAPVTARLTAGSSAALETGWPVVNVRPQKHTAYAVQWFTMALVLALFFIHRSSNLWDLLRSRSS